MTLSSSDTPLELSGAGMVGTFDVVLADPPWSYYGSGTKMAAAAKHYALMSDEEMMSFPLADWLAPKGVAFVWATSPRLDFAIDCIRSWGLHYRGVAFVWVKTTKDGKPLGARGVRPSIVKPTTELVLAASRVHRGRPMPLASESVVQTVFAPVMEHSRKPTEVHQRIEQLYPDASRIELFARRPHPGWEVWGNECVEVCDDVF